MVDITLPDGSVRTFEKAVTGAQVAASIGAGLAKSALAVSVNGELWDLSRPIEEDVQLSIMTKPRKKEDPTPERLALLRHDCAHVLAEAVQDLFPDTQVTIGPSIENGFYYDFYRQIPFSTDDLETIEAKMAEIIDRDTPFTREVLSREDALDLFAQKGEDFKVELIQDLPDEQTITIYRQGDWLDLCRGPHGPSTGWIGKAFKLQRVSGAYWRGDSNRQQLQRIYGTAFETNAQLETYLHQLEEAEKRDHRKLGREMDLFHFQEEAPGSVFWHPKGWTLFSALTSYMAEEMGSAGYNEVNTPQIMDRTFWERSGHWDKYQENMFTAHVQDEQKDYAVKPMNCPGHVEIFNQGIRSYRDLPFRVSEFGKVHRYEPSGALHGLMRVRAFTQDDAHVFVTQDQLLGEVQRINSLILTIYQNFGFDAVRVKLSTRPEKRIGSDEVWDHAEKSLADALDGAGIEYSLFEGEGAFYGPKLEFVLRDAIGRDWQCGTCQVDFNLPERLEASFIAEDGKKHRPVMIHQAVFGSLERFTGILLEHHAGRLPLWLSPVQVVVAPITTVHADYAQKVKDHLTKAGLRVDCDLRNEKVNLKIREHSLSKVPVIAVVGAREEAEETVTLRRLGSTAQQTFSLEEATQSLGKEALPPSRQ